MKGFGFIQYLISDYGASLIDELFNNRYEDLVNKFANIYTALEYETNEKLKTKTNRTANPIEWWIELSQNEQHILLLSYKQKYNIVVTIDDVNYVMRCCRWLDENITQTWLINNLGDTFGYHLYLKYLQAAKISAYMLNYCDDFNRECILKIVKL